MNHYDIIIIGSGAGGGTLAHALAPTGKRILLIERGPFLPREKENWDVKAVFLDNRYTTTEPWYDKKGKQFHPGNHYYVGGNTKVYGACLLRLREKDFETLQHEDGISPAWPLKYADFQPYYLRAEKLYHVHGKRKVDPTEPPEKEEFPYEALSHEERIQELYDGIKKTGLHPFPLPLGLHLNEKHRENSPCIRCDTCDGFPCLVHAKSDAEISCVHPALASPNVQLLINAKAIKLSSKGKSVTQVEVERNGQKETYSADLFVVSCGAANSAALLLRSNLANSSGLVGRHYMCHNNSAIVALSRKPNLTNYEKTFGVNDFYFSAPDYPYPLGHIQLLGNVKKDMLKAGAPPFTPDSILKTMERHAVGWWITTEDLPDPNNRVALNSQGEIVLHYTPNNSKSHHLLFKKLKSILNSLDHTFLPSNLFLYKKMSIEAVAHQVGTCRFGTDPKTSVLDINCKAHDLDNLYVVDGSFFPASGAVNPGLTIIANALRVGDILKNQM